MTPISETIPAGLRDLAGWLEQHEIDLGYAGRELLLPLTTNQAVADFARRHGLTLRYNPDGNAFCDQSFGPVRLHAYGYADYDTYRRRSEHDLIRHYAERHRLRLIPDTTGPRQAT